jgi:hypothetical protein
VGKQGGGVNLSLRATLLYVDDLRTGAPGRSRRDYRRQPQGNPTSSRCHSIAWRAPDPQGLLNPGVLIDF